MEGHVCNIQVLLRAAEFLERRERGECFCDNCQCYKGGGSWLLLKQQNAQWSDSECTCRMQHRGTVG